MSKPANHRLAAGLGWASVGLGVPMLASTGRFLQAIGVGDEADARAWTRVVGVRELVAAAGILAIERPRPKLSLWGRVAGDAMDTALLVSALRGKPKHRTRLLAALGLAGLVATTDLVAAVGHAEDRSGTDERLDDQPSEQTADLHRATGPTHERAAITVRRPREEVYAFWHDFENLPRFTAHLESVERTPEGTTHWVTKGPAGRTIAWDAEVVEDVPNERIAWRSTEGATVPNHGTVRFLDAPRDGGTEIHLEIHFDPPAGVLGTAVAKLFGEHPHQQVRDDLRRFKQVVETGEVVRSDGSPDGHRAARQVKQRPAQPLEGSVA